MNKTYLLLDILWFVWMLKYVLFWLYLWQLKEYHIGRFADHFRTYKGKKLIFNFVQIFKLFLLILFLVAGGFLVYLSSILLLLYFGELILFLRGIINKSIKKPKITFKILFLGAISFIITVLFLLWILRFKKSYTPISLLGFDILTPIIVSLIVLLFQPIFVAIRNNTLRKARKKIEKIKLVSGLKVIAITGSYGKTSTKEFLSAILSEKFKVLKTNEHQNSEIGIAKCILRDLKPMHQIFIAEVGAYSKGKVREVCSFLKPKVGVVTGVNEQHLALFGSMENLLSAEGGGELASALYNGGLLIVNGDNKYCLDLYKKWVSHSEPTPPSMLDRNIDSLEGGVARPACKIYSLSNKIIDSDIWSEDVEVDKDHISFIGMDKRKEMAHFEARVLGKQNVQNLLGAILVAKELGMNFGEISEACKNISEEQAGMTLKHGKHGINIIDSSYSANPDGVFADLDYLSVFDANPPSPVGYGRAKKVIVMPCLIELGEKSMEIHEKIGRKIAEVCDLAIITSKDKFDDLKRGAIKSGLEEKNIILCASPKDIYLMITLFCKSDDAVLLEGRVPPGLITLLAGDKNL